MAKSNDNKENKLTIGLSFGSEHIKWQKGASLLVHIVTTETPQIIMIEGVFPSLTYIEALERVIRRKIEKHNLEPHKRYKLEMLYTSSSPRTTLNGYSLKSIEKIPLGNLEISL